MLGPYGESVMPLNFISQVSFHQYFEAVFDLPCSDKIKRSLSYFPKAEMFHLSSSPVLWTILMTAVSEAVVFSITKRPFAADRVFSEA